ncbi:MAG: hypothetical protein IJE43_19105 [Alphaproteobacteria bacterium]|nr:hypothetical protein [Alphaproteobacteria bacterium]
MKNPVGTIIAIMAIVYLIYVSPANDIGLIQWARSQSEALSYTRELIDGVIDTRLLTEDMLEDYALNMASASELYEFNITRKEKCIMPDPKHPGKTYTTYIVVDDISQYNQGDKIIVEVKPVGTNMYQKFSSAFSNTAALNKGFRLAGRVR